MVLIEGLVIQAFAYIDAQNGVASVQDATLTGYNYLAILPLISSHVMRDVQ